jgi:site-specific recombinase XerD
MQGRLTYLVQSSVRGEYVRQSLNPHSTEAASDVDAVRRFRATWPDAAITASRNLERLRNFFRFCHDAGWMDKNPAKAVRPPKVTPSPTLPFEPEQIDQILAACET